MAIQGLWAGPWLRDVSGLDPATAAEYLFWIAAAMVAGFLGMGQLTYRLSRLGVAPLGVAVSGMALFMLAQLALLLGWGPIGPLWALFGFFGTAPLVNGHRHQVRYGARKSFDHRQFSKNRTLCGRG